MKKEKISALRKRISLVLLLLIIGFSVFMFYGHSVSSIGAHAFRVKTLLKTYIIETGDFPEDQSDLEASNVLRIKINDGKPVYYIRSSKFDPSNPDEPSGWKEGGFKFDLFSIAYGTNLDNLEMKDYTLQDKMTGQETLLINGPYGTKFPRHLKKTYQDISRSWFEEYETFNLNKEK